MSEQMSIMSPEGPKMPALCPKAGLVLRPSLWQCKKPGWKECLHEKSTEGSCIFCLVGIFCLPIVFLRLRPHVNRDHKWHRRTHNLMQSVKTSRYELSTVSLALQYPVVPLLLQRTDDIVTRGPAASINLDFRTWWLILSVTNYPE